MQQFYYKLQSCAHYFTNKSKPVLLVHTSSPIHSGIFAHFSIRHDNCSTLTVSQSTLQLLNVCPLRQASVDFLGWSCNLNYYYFIIINYFIFLITPTDHRIKTNYKFYEVFTHTFSYKIIHKKHLSKTLKKTSCLILLKTVNIH